MGYNGCNAMKLVFCHRIPERTFKIGNYYFPVCSRCTGLYLGLFSSIIIFLSLNIKPVLIFILLGGLMIFPTFIDGLSQHYALRESRNSIRVVTGSIGGLGLGIIILSIIIIIPF